VRVESSWGQTRLERARSYVCLRLVANLLAQGRRLQNQPQINPAPAET
jgi:hypothetical protein